VRRSHSPSNWRALSTEDDETLDDWSIPDCQLAQDGIVYIDDSEEIDVMFFMPLARLLANMASPTGSPINEAAKLRDEQICAGWLTKPT
jgi:hypothetical protein